MNPLALTFVIIFWLPAAIVIAYNLFWDIKFWQLQDYRFQRMAQHLRWDFAITHRRPLYTLAKLLLFTITLSFIAMPGSAFPLLGTLIAFALWVNEVFSIGEKLLSHKFPYIESTIRNVSILVSGIVILAIPPLLLSLYLLAINPPELSIAGISLLPMTTESGIVIIPLTYLFLIFSTLLALVYDLGSPLITTVLVFLTSPLAWLEKQFYAFVAKLFLSNHTNLMVIAITGSHGKTTTRQALAHLLSTDYNVATTGFTETSLHRLAISIITSIKPSTRVFIAEINAYSASEMAAMTKLLNPQIAIFTGLDTSHIGLFGSTEKMLATNAELVKHLLPKSTVIYNGDDKLLRSLAGQTDSKEIFYHVHNDHTNIPDNDLVVDNYYVSDVKQKGTALKFVLHNQTREVQLTAPANTKGVIDSLVASIAAATEAGVSMETVVAHTDNLPWEVSNPELIAGDNHTLLAFDNRSLSVRKFHHLLDYIHQVPAPQRVVVTSGIHHLRELKPAVYAELADKLRNIANVVISYDKHLIEVLQTDNSKLELVSVSQIDELIYAVRTTAEEGAIILLAGTLDPSILAALRDE